MTKCEVGAGGAATAYKATEAATSLTTMDDLVKALGEGVVITGEYFSAIKKKLAKEVRRVKKIYIETVGAKEKKKGTEYL